MTVYGTARFTSLGIAYTASLTCDGWNVEPPSRRILETLELFCAPSQFGPSLGNPMAVAIERAAQHFAGTCELATLPIAPAGVLF